MSFKQNIRNYDDFDFIQRRRNIRNVPFFRNLPDHIIEELVYLIKSKRYEANTTIVKRGDTVDCLYFLKSGKIVVEVPSKRSEIKVNPAFKNRRKMPRNVENLTDLNQSNLPLLGEFPESEEKQKFWMMDSTYMRTVGSEDFYNLNNLNEGSCFCIFSAFSDEI